MKIDNVSVQKKVKWEKIAVSFFLQEYFDLIYIL